MDAQIGKLLEFSSSYRSNSAVLLQTRKFSLRLGSGSKLVLDSLSEATAYWNTMPSHSEIYDTFIISNGKSHTVTRVLWEINVVAVFLTNSLKKRIIIILHWQSLFLLDSKSSLYAS